ncbi:MULTISPECIES: OmpH family outer membrane protein [Flavobacterium]|uniref:OmpH family outer membrane protein n=2 Tax=Flavobacterium TaxID=237 RepID=A0A940X5B1_9FLAO|nr:MULTISPECIES: OmpH family outer membrane protein [Flavobacterium]MBP4136579.1 OmpH family outer membrane protein [Flavobacterium geliluteum]MDX6183567.1 OmpH family outer membrane protein [Flavobacterium sp. Fl-33]MDX6187031.1 OmpH family outer membrane protein [Flavobacterium sp. Fl-77]UFH40237.1 OmpH family outer membrane protein [Flavobacterium sp. F-70]
MIRQFLFIFLALIVANTSQAQTRTTRIGYIDMEYILENVSDYKEAKAQLELKAQKWKQDVESKKIDINKLKENLKAERALLTKELIEEKETEIKFLETEMLDYQQKQFGADGNLMRQKAALSKPIQDQVFTAVQDIAEAKNYDFIFDKSSDLTMLFSNKRFDISDQVIRSLNRTEKREQLSKKELKEQEKKENLENELDENPAMADRQKALDQKRAAREKLILDRKLEQEAKKKEYEDRRNAIAAEREAKKNGTVSETTKPETTKTDAIANPDAKTTNTEPVVNKAEERQRLYEQRKKELEERKKKIIEEREAAKKAKEAETQKPNTTNN